MEIKKSEFKQRVRYIYDVHYDEKKGENYPVIQKVYYFRLDENNKPIRKWLEANVFAEELYNNRFISYAGKYDESSKMLKDAVKVLAYMDNDKEYWIKTKPNDTRKDNFEFIEYAKKHNFAELVK